LDHAANSLHSPHGKCPREVEARAFGPALILPADREFTASTFAARGTAGTLADMYAAITSAIGALSGPLHGGANEQVMRMLLGIGSPGKIDKVVNDKLEAGGEAIGTHHTL